MLSWQEGHSVSAHEGGCLTISESLETFFTLSLASEMYICQFLAEILLIFIVICQMEIFTELLTSLQVWNLTWNIEICVLLLKFSRDVQT